MTRIRYLNIKKEFFDLMLIEGKDSRFVEAQKWWERHVVAVGGTHTIDRELAGKFEKDGWAERAKENIYFSIAEEIMKNSFGIIERETSPIGAEIIQRVELWVLK